MSVFIIFLLSDETSPPKAGTSMEEKGETGKKKRKGKSEQKGKDILDAYL